MFDIKIAFDHLTSSNNGQRRLVATLGAKDFVTDTARTYVAFKVPLKGAKFNYVELSLEKDFYCLKLQRWVWSKSAMKSEEIVKGIFFEDLRAVFESKMGVRVLLF